MKKTVTTACFMLVSGGVLWAWTNGGMVANRAARVAASRNMAPAEGTAC